MSYRNNNKNFDKHVKKLFSKRKGNTVISSTRKQAGKVIHMEAVLLCKENWVRYNYLQYR